jgi:hypothetical protein
MQFNFVITKIRKISSFYLIIITNLARKGSNSVENLLGWRWFGKCVDRFV